MRELRPPKNDVVNPNDFVKLEFWDKVFIAGVLFIILVTLVGIVWVMIPLFA